MMESTEDKIKYLQRRGWQCIEPQIDWQYLAKSNWLDLVDSAGQFMSEIVEATRDNPFGWFNDKGKQARQRLIEKLSPMVLLPRSPLYVPLIEVELPPPEGTEVDRAFELLGLAVIDIARRQLLPAPNYIGQQVDTTLMVHTQPQQFDWNEAEIKGAIVAQWEDVAQLRISKQMVWKSSNGATIGQLWQFYSHQLRDIATAAMENLGIEIGDRAYQVGKLCPEFKLDQFPQYIQEISDKLRWQIFESSTVERFNILVQGPPGTGKTRWAQSFAAEVLSPLGYLVAVLDYKSLEYFQLPDYVDKVCVIVNDADNLCLDRSQSPSGTTEKILAWLDGSRAGYIQPLYLPSRTSTITILTANTTERWDSAGLRRGRIHADFTFDQILA